MVAKRDLDFPKDDDPGHPYITAQKTNNMNNMGGGNVGINSKRVLAFNFDTGYAGYQTTVEVGEKVPPNGKGETISFAFDGSVGHAAYQHEPYYGGTQVGIITLKKDYNFKEMGLFVAFLCLPKTGDMITNENATKIDSVPSLAYCRTKMEKLMLKASRN